MTEACLESPDGHGSWDRITKKQEKCRWKEGGKPGREEWLRVLLLFQSAELLTMLEVQTEIEESDVAFQVGCKRRKGSNLLPLRRTDYATPPLSSVKVELVERSTSTAKVFPQYQIQEVRQWPSSDFFNAVSKKLTYRSKFKICPG